MNKTIKTFIEKNSLNKLHTKEGRANFWYYNRIPTYVGIFILFILVISIWQCSTMIRPDLQIFYAGMVAWPDEYIEELEGELSQYVSDINGDGDKVASIATVIYDAWQPDPQMHQKLILEFSESDSRLFILDKDVYESFKDMAIFADLKDVLNTPDSVYYANIVPTEFIKEQGLDSYYGDMVVCMKFLREKHTEKQALMQENAKKIVQYFANVTNTNIK